MSGSLDAACPRPAREVSVGGHKVVGAKHVRDGRPCQDDIQTARDGSVVALAVADGHGSSIHAEIGARIAVEVTTEQLLLFAANLGSESCGDPRTVHGLAQDPFRRLLVREWVRRVREHAGADDVILTDYGSTLIFALVTPAFMLLGQLGDGDLIVVDGGGTVSRPLPADPRCFGEETSSLCLPDASTSLRVLAIPVPDGEILLLVSTDGYGKSYATDADFERIGPDYLAMVRDIGVSGVSENLEEFLTVVTTGGSGDDIALGLVYLPPIASTAQCAEVSADEPVTPPDVSPVPDVLPSGDEGPVPPLTAQGPWSDVCPLLRKSPSSTRLSQRPHSGDST